ncbi:DarT ssDNA thymidine ADP-ribosyltransferase family protein [Brevibacillus fluminis]|uniref:DarT ssDNA thymidine ADP-ribosyltransferase family protein n=1 Tax=Brevibacillus fluminis TaxID=511487 RepID=UPI003F886E5F
MSIRDQKLIYHLTSIQNFESILQSGLLPRNQLDGFVDIADAEIIEFREDNSITDYVPFHFFAKNPFDGRVQKDRPDEEFVYICLKRSYAKENDFLIIPQHPISMEEFKMYPYEEGFELIDWDTMDIRDYSDALCKNICMAECVSSLSIDPSDFHCIFVKNADQEKLIKELSLKHYESIPYMITVNSKMFLS